MTDNTRRIAPSAASREGPELRIRQKRGQVTYDALLDTAFAMLEHKEFDEISVAELAQKAGYSVGAFYARFRSKDELFDAMVLRHVQNRRDVRRRQFATANDSALLHELLDETVHYYWSRRRFWRAALIRSIREPEFWAPMRKLSHEFARRAARAITRARRPRADTARGRQRALRGAARVRAHQQHDPEPPGPLLPRARAVRRESRASVQARLRLRCTRRSG